LEEILTYNFFRYRSWFEAFFYLLVGHGGGELWKDGTSTLQLLLEAPLTAQYLHITIAVWVPFENILLAHYSCCWWPLWKKGTMLTH